MAASYPVVLWFGACGAAGAGGVPISGHQGVETACVAVSRLDCKGVQW